MASVVSFGTTDLITVRICFKVDRAGSGVFVRYSSTVFAAFPFFIFQNEWWLSNQNTHTDSPKKRIINPLTQMESTEKAPRTRCPRENARNSSAIAPTS